MSARGIRLRIITERDNFFLYELMSSPQAGGRVRYGGATASPDKIASTLWESVLAQFIIESTGSQKSLGLVAITSPNFRDGFVYTSALGSPEAQGPGLIAEGVLLWFNYAFMTWPFRKMCMEATEESYRAFKSGLGRFFSEEGRLRTHSYWNGHFMDLLILAVYRETWARYAPVYLNRLHAGS
jgi:RimJ/RimL family protein N-acetyltransferase